MTRWLLALALAAAPAAGAVESERLYLSGTGHGDAVEWEFFCTEGRNSGVWTTIPVPSQWELEGFGRYNYGHDEKKSREEGRYRYRFRVPAEWRDRRVELVFEGVMTDTRVEVNGTPAGPEHRGGFYRFRYDVGELLRFGGDNLLTVRVRKHSADGSVNRAERQADYWVFGGIYRPVYLEASPRQGISRLAADARHDGALRLQVFLHGATGPGLDDPGRLTARVETLTGEPVDRPLTVAVGAGTNPAELEGTIAGAATWSAETPTLHRLVVELHREGALLHRRSERVGFRTVELRPGEGLFVNGRKTLLKGVNRHAFWPPSGRTLNRAIDRRDAELVKAMNLNAVRASHYPPDPSFLAACDELGIYVVDELAGWHDAYGTAVGRRRVAEMVTRDVNHPSILLWANGNEGGWNRRLDAEFRRHDPQRRPVIHPGDVAGGVDAYHYPTYAELAAHLDPKSSGNRWRDLFGELPVVMPTEVLHGLYDGGSGAGLEDYWQLLRSAPRAAGAFLWSFSDEAVVRSDRQGALDTDGSHAPDGILGPYRERSGSYYAVREIFSPIRLAEAGVLAAPPATPGSHPGLSHAALRAPESGLTLGLENRFVETDLERCRFHWALVDLPGPGEAFAPGVLASGEVAAPAVPPGAIGELTLPPIGLPGSGLPGSGLPGSGLPGADALRLQARDPHGREVAAWMLPVRDLRADFKAFRAPGKGVEVEETEDRVTFTASGATVELDRRSGELRALAAGSARLGLRGPRPADGRVRPPATILRTSEGPVQFLEARYGEGESLVWALHPSGWLRLELETPAAGGDFEGLVFALAGDGVRRFRWLGDGPTRVWRNRLAGGTLGVWSKDAAAATPVTSAAEPKLEGFYAGVYWAELATPSGELQLAFESGGLYLGLGSPEFPPDARNAVAAAVPPGLGLYREIPAIGTKFKPAAELGPQSRPATAGGTYRGVVWLRLVAETER